MSALDDHFCIDIRITKYDVPDGQFTIFHGDKEQAIKLAIRHLMLEVPKVEQPQPELDNNSKLDRGILVSLTDLNKKD